MKKGISRYKVLWAMLTVVVVIALAWPLKICLPKGGRNAAPDSTPVSSTAAASPAVVPAVQPVTAPAPAPAKSAPYLQILMYHEIGDGPNGLYVSVKNFEQQMKYLHDNGYCGITLNEGKALLDGRGTLPAGKPVVLTFDDAYSSFMTYAYPVLSQYGFRATVFVITDRTGNSSYPNHLTWEQIGELAAYGMEIGSHTKSHPSLPTLSPAGLDEEIRGSKTILEEHLAQPVYSFCYPAGEYNPAVVDAVARAGYQQAVTVKYGWAIKKNAPFEIPRIRISRYLTYDKFVEMFAPPVPAQSPSAVTSGKTVKP